MTLNSEGASSAPEQTPQTSSEPPLPTPVGFGDTVPIESNDATPNSSAAIENKQDAKEPEDLLSAVRNAVEPKTEVAGSTSDTAGGKSSGSTTAAEGNTGDSGTQPAEEDDSKLPFHNHPRWKQVIQERDTYKGAATQFNQVLQYMAHNNLSSQEVERGMEIMALMKNNPLAALEALRPHYDGLRQFAGEALPQDIAHKVQEGFIDRETAVELAKQRNQAAFLAQQQQEHYKRQQEDLQAQQYRQHVESIQSTVNSWEAQVKTRDPDYNHKAGLIGDRVRVLLTQYQPRNPQEAVQLAEKAYADVNSSLGGLSPRRQPMRSVSSSTSSASNATRAPRTLLEAAQMAMGG
jgi:hypothetical protein